MNYILFSIKNYNFTPKNSIPLGSLQIDFIDDLIDLYQFHKLGLNPYSAMNKILMIIYDSNK